MMADVATIPMDYDKQPVSRLKSFNPADFCKLRQPLRRGVFRGAYARHVEMAQRSDRALFAAVE